MRFKIDWANLIAGSKFTIFALSYFVFESNFPSTSPLGLIFGGRFNGRFFALQVWGAYMWRGLYIEGLFFGILLYGICHLCNKFTPQLLYFAAYLPEAN